MRAFFSLSLLMLFNTALLIALLTGQQPAAYTAETPRTIMFAPWRKNAHAVYKNTKHCALCKPIDSYLPGELLAETEHCVIKLNKFPYRAGHLLIVPKKHLCSLTDLGPGIRHDIMEALTRATLALKKVLGCDGCSICINMGQCTGASIPEHLHIHVLPRTPNDISGVEMFAQSTLVIESAEEMGAKLKKHL